MGTHLPGPDVDHAGNPMCGQDFMAGTICSLWPNHDGPHGTICQVCGGDWYSNECTCISYCSTCNGRLDEIGLCDDFNCLNCGYDDGGDIAPTCARCRYPILFDHKDKAWLDRGNGEGCTDDFGQEGVHVPEPPPVTQAEIDEVIEYLTGKRPGEAN